MKNGLIVREEFIDFHGLRFLCIYGKHVNGGFVAFPEWGVSAELSVHLCDEGYNSCKILAALERSSYSCWLPYGNSARKQFAYDLSLLITERVLRLVGSDC